MNAAGPAEILLPDPPVTTKRRKLSPFVRKLIVAAMLSFGISILSLSLRSTGNAAHKDFIAYWAAGHLLVEHGNPYDTTAVLKLERSAGFVLAEPIFMRNPPYALLLAAPLGFMGPNFGAVFWSLLIVASVVVSIRLLRVLHGSAEDSCHLLGYLFAPVLSCIVLGQTSAFVLLGLTVFFTVHGKRPVLAGISLLLLTIKPHLFCALGVTLVAWLITRKQYRTIGACCLGLIGCSFATLAFFPSVWTDYWNVLAAAQAESQLIPTVSAMFRLTVGRGAAWTQFVPAALACVWAVYYFWRQKARWDWMLHGSFVLLVSVLTAPYSWLPDEVVVLPAILGTLYAKGNINSILIWFGVLDGIALLAVVAGVQVGSGFYIWTTTAWLGWFSYSRFVHRSQISRNVEPHVLVS